MQVGRRLPILPHGHCPGVIILYPLQHSIPGNLRTQFPVRLPPVVLDSDWCIVFPRKNVVLAHSYRKSRVARALVGVLLS